MFWSWLQQTFADGFSKCLELALENECLEVASANIYRWLLQTFTGGFSECPEVALVNVQKWLQRMFRGDLGEHSEETLVLDTVYLASHHHNLSLSCFTQCKSVNLKVLIAFQYCLSLTWSCHISVAYESIDQVALWINILVMIMWHTAW